MVGPRENFCIHTSKMLSVLAYGTSVYVTIAGDLKVTARETADCSRYVAEAISISSCLRKIIAHRTKGVALLESL
jgi:hypothetical protein